MHLVSPIDIKGKPFLHRLSIITSSFHRPEYQSLADFRNQHGIPRTTLYEGRRRVQEALAPLPPGPNPHLQEIKRLHHRVAILENKNTVLNNRLALLEDRLACSVEVTSERVDRLMLAMAAEPVATRGIHTLIAEAYGPEYAPADNTIARRINTLGQIAGEIIDEAVDKTTIDHIAPDEIFFHQTPILAVVHPKSSALLDCRRSEDRTAESWFKILKSYRAPQCLATSDLGSGLTAALKKLHIPNQGDMFHGLRRFTKCIKHAEAIAVKALNKEDAIRKKVTMSGRRGPKPLDSLRCATLVSYGALDALEHLMDGQKAFAQAVSPISQAYELATEVSQRCLMDQAIAHIEVLALEGSRVRGVRELYTHLKRNRDTYLRFIDDLWDITVEVNADSPWTANHLIAVAAKPLILCAALKWERNFSKRRHIQDQLPETYAQRWKAFNYCPNFSMVEEAVSEKLRHLKRASSMMECVNSQLRPLQSVKKTVNQPFLNLFALKHNMTPYERSQKRKGYSPYQLLGVKVPGEDTGWIGAVIHRAKLKESLPAAA